MRPSRSYTEQSEVNFTFSALTVQQTCNTSHSYWTNLLFCFLTSFGGGPDCLPTKWRVAFDSRALAYKDVLQSYSNMHLSCILLSSWSHLHICDRWATFTHIKSHNSTLRITASCQFQPHTTHISLGLLAHCCQVTKVLLNKNNRLRLCVFFLETLGLRESKEQKYSANISICSVCTFFWFISISCLPSGAIS